MTGVDDLVAFLRARLDEDETAATAGVQWFSTDDLAPNGGFSRAAQAAKRGDIRSVGAWHPARVFREVEAKRVIVDSHVATAAMLRLLAAVYSDHPDYREEWKP